ncbi:hypothetical protein [Paenibacillus qinlingensis]|nr:hypothetical protein [Paenibacillus qinlingensis]
MERGVVKLPVRIGILFNDFGTYAVYLGAVCISLLWLKRGLKSQSKIVRRIGKWVLKLHEFSGWAVVVLIVAHSIYFLIKEIHVQYIYSGAASLIILLTIVGYGSLIRKVRNIWMRAIHRYLAIVWIPVLWIHAGKDVIFAAVATFAVVLLVNMLEKASVRSNG